jgi:hypothetical protein
MNCLLLMMSLLLLGCFFLVESVGWVGLGWVLACWCLEKEIGRKRPEIPRGVSYTDVTALTLQPPVELQPVTGYRKVITRSVTAQECPAYTIQPETIISLLTNTKSFIHFNTQNKQILTQLVQFSLKWGWSFIKMIVKEHEECSKTGIDIGPWWGDLQKLESWIPNPKEFLRTIRRPSQDIPTP